ncbi:conserved hypothetical protein [Tenacibaculum sp. 190524A05c]|uniref:LysM domain-containing protein n=2 Tax=Tenacibaculum platacis TaxID=3137852 RepID=A0ABM9NZN0_9FLAO
MCDIHVYMKKGFLLFSLFLSISIFSQEKKLPEGWDKILLEGKTAYMNLITGEVSESFPKKAARKPEPVVEYDPTITHKVVKGETLSTIARKYEMSLAQLYRLNSLQDFDSIEIGDEIVIGYEDEKKKMSNNTLNRKETSFENIGKKKHIVQSGETLYGISRKYKTSIHSIRKINNLESDNIFVGQVLKIK